MSDVPPDTSIPSPAVTPNGPQRSENAKRKRGPVRRTGGKQKWGSAGTRSRGVSWGWQEAKDRFVWEMLEVYFFKPAGGEINPEKAFAEMTAFIKEDLHRSVSNFFLPWVATFV